MQASIKLNLTNMHNRFCLWRTVSTKRWLGLNTPVVTEFVWRSVSAPHTSPDVNTLCPFHLAASRFDEQRADISLRQMDPKLHKIECEKLFQLCASVEILFAMVSFAMYTTLVFHGVVKCKAQCPNRDDH